MNRLLSVSLYLESADTERRRDALCQLREIILPPSTIWQARGGYVGCWQLWPPTGADSLVRLRGTWTVRRRGLERVIIAEYPWLSYTFDDLECALKAPSHVIERVMIAGLSTEGASAYRIAAFTDLTNALRQTVKLSLPAVARIWEYMPCGRSMESSYPEYLLNIHPSPTDLACRFIADVLVAVHDQSDLFHYEVGDRMLWLHLPSAREWWERTTGWKLGHMVLRSGLRTFPHLVVEQKRSLAFGGRRMQCVGIDLAEWHNIRHGR